MAANLTDIIRETAVRLPDQAAQRYFDGTQWVDRTYRQLWELIQATARGLREMGVKPQDRVAILAKTRPEWVVADYAILLIDAVTVPIYPSSPADQIAYIVEDAGISVAIAENGTLAQKFPPSVRVLIIEATTDFAAQERFAAFESVARPGDSIAPAHTRADLATLVYTSGTTGLPKGVMLTHGNLLANAEAIRSLLNAQLAMHVTTNDVALAFLPLSHILERTGHNVLLWEGATVAYARSTDDLPQDLLEVRPTVMIAVPRVFEKIYARIQGEVSGYHAAKRYLFDRALQAGLARYAALAQDGAVPALLESRARLYDRLVFEKVRAAVGGRLRYVIAGGAPLTADIGRFFFAVGIPVLEGYGLTETAPVLAVNTPPVPKYGTVGRPLPGIEIRIADDGEILARGPSVMSGYWNLEEETQAALENGWLHTGDLGELTPEGYLRVTDRKKYIIVLSTGKNVAPQAVEQRLILSPLIEQAVVLGNRRKYVAALLYLDPGELARWAQQHNKGRLDMPLLLKDPDLMAHVTTEVAHTTADMASFERPKRVAFLPKPLSEERGELTPSLKVKLPVVERNYQRQIDELYSDASDVRELIASGDGPKSTWGRTLAAIAAGVALALIIRFVIH
jgi:long-chain acyl-CoA synthetase